MEIYFSLNKKYNKKILYKLIELHNLSNLNLILWGKFNKKFRVKNENYLNVIKFLRSKEDFYWWLYNNDFSVEYSNEFSNIIVESYNSNIFKINYNLLKDECIENLLISIDSFANIIKIKKYLKENLKNDDILYEDEYSIEYKYIKFLFIHNEFSIELKKTDYISTLKDMIKKLFSDKLIYDEISIINIL